MKKFLFPLLLLFTMPAAWAGTGDGSKEYPYTGEWQATDLVKVLKVGDRLAYDCVIKAGDISILDIFLGKICTHWADWAMGNAIDETPYFMYNDYCSWNTLDERKSQTFIVTSVIDLSGQRIYFSGYYSGTYLRPDVNGFVHVTNATNLKKAIQNNNDAKIRLMDDIYLSDVEDRAFCSTFTGTLDGNGNTIWAARPEVKHDGGGHYKRSYFFTHAIGATVKNLTFRNVREQNEDWENQSIIVQDAKACVFDNITFDNISIWAKKDKAGAVAGYAENCTITNITVKNSDITTDKYKAGTVVGEANTCTFANIEVIDCEATAGWAHVGGVVGYATSCSFTDINIYSGCIESHRTTVGGVVGYAKEGSTFRNCVVYDQTCVYADGTYNYHAMAGGIAGEGNSCYFYNCINSAFVAGKGKWLGGIASDIHLSRKSDRPTIVDCLNTGMVMAISGDVVRALFNDYKLRYMPCHTRFYNGKEYTIRNLSNSQLNHVASEDYVGGMVGELWNGDITRCANIGSIYSKGSSIGGIAAYFYQKCTVSDCLSDFECNANNDIYSIVGKTDERCTISNCLNLTNRGIIKKPQDNSCSNNYTLRAGMNESYEKSVTKEQLASGKTAIMLGDNWEQNLGTDTYPTPTGSRGIYHTRTISDEFGTACLPYALRSDDNISFFTFDKATGVSGDVELQFEYAETVPAGTPVLFVTEQTGDICIPDAKDGYKWELPQITPNGNWQMDGTFTGASFAGDAAKYIYYVSEDDICNSESTVIAPFHAFLHGPNADILIDADDTTPIKEVRYLMASSGGDLGIKALDNDITPHNPSLTTFTLMGAKAPAGYKGIVIENGRKVVQR